MYFGIVIDKSVLILTHIFRLFTKNSGLVKYRRNENFKQLIFLVISTLGEITRETQLQCL